MIDNQEIVGRLALAALLAGLVGLERGRMERAAGLRTHALVGVGSCLFMLVSAFGFKDTYGTPNITIDPTRVAAQVVSGIGFLGAGTIIFQREVVRGLTTAASIWTVAALGLAVGGGLYIPAACTTVLILLILAGFKPLERRLNPSRRQPVRLIIDPRLASLRAIRGAVEGVGLALERVLIEPGDTPDEDRMKLWVRRCKGAASQGDDRVDLVDSLRQIPGIQRIESTLALSPAGAEADTVEEEELEQQAASVPSDRFTERRREEEE